MIRRSKQHHDVPYTGVLAIINEAINDMLDEQVLEASVAGALERVKK